MKGLVNLMSRQPINLKKISSIKNIGKEKLILLAFAGILLIGSSYFESVGHDEEVETTLENNEPGITYENTLKDEIKKIIQRIDVISYVQVMITFKSGK